MWPFTAPNAATIGLTDEQCANLAAVRARLDELIALGPLTREQRRAFIAVIERYRDPMGKEARVLRDRVERAGDGDLLPISDEDPWAATAREDLAAIANHDAWIALLAMAADGSKPTKKWQAAAGSLVAAIGAPFVATIRRWFEQVTPRPVVRNASNWFTPAMADANSDALRNLVWACASISDNDAVAVIVGDLAVRCFTKIPGVGPLSMKSGNACIYVLSQLPGLRAVSQLARLGSRLRYKQAIALVDKAKVECAKRVGMEPIDLEEIALPSFGLDVTGRTRVTLGEHVAEIATDGVDATLTFFAGTKPLKSVPTAVKTEHAEELKELKATHKELAALVPTLRYRLERWLIEPRTWTLGDLRARYLDHPLAAALARRLIYTTETTSVIFLDGYPLGVDGKQVELADHVRLSLWHPLDRPAAEIAAWRALFASLEITQPIKQLDRELYIPGEERNAGESTRFANRIVRQHQFAALCRERGWAYRLQGGFDSANTPTKLLPAFDLTVELDAEGGGAMAASSIFVNVTIGALRFLRGGQLVRLGAVPPRCFSEVLRDADLFISVCA